MGFDYDEIIKKVIEKVDILNLNGRNKVKRILECLKLCPFIEVIAEYLEMGSDVAVYNKLKYYLDEEDVSLLYKDLKIRRKQCQLDYRGWWKLQLEDMDAIKNARNENKNGGG